LTTNGIAKGTSMCSTICGRINSSFG
jgi:hypothetical protein